MDNLHVNYGTCLNKQTINKQTIVLVPKELAFKLETEYILRKAIFQILNLKFCKILPASEEEIIKGLSYIGQVERNMPNDGKSHRCPNGKLEKYKVAFESKQSKIKTTK